MASKFIAKFGYENSTETKNYSMEIPENVTVDATYIAGIKERVNAINASLEGGTSDGLNTFFVDSANNNFAKISEARIETVTEEIIYGA